MLERCNLDTFTCDCVGNFNTNEKYTETSNVKEKQVEHKHQLAFGYMTPISTCLGKKK